MANASSAQQGQPLVACDRGQPQIFEPACPGDPDQTQGGNPQALYNLGGTQVEPTAGYWTLGTVPELVRVVPIAFVDDLTENSGSEFYIPRYPIAQDALEWEIAELEWLEDHRDDPEAVAGDFSQVRQPPASLDAIYRDARRSGISQFINLDPPPFGAIFNIGSRPQHPIEDVNQQHLRLGALPDVVTTGRQLARMFQDETPGLLHRHALNYLLYKRVFDPPISPPRQARVWMALDLAIYSALSAAWYYKLVADPEYRYRQRPYEYDRNRHFRVLYDDVVDDCGEFDKCARNTGCPSPGTPRHPAFPSGHSTYSAAASEVLAYFFPDERAELEALANNIGTARLWAGVHWRSDHIAGQRLGRAVAKLLIDQLRQDCVPVYTDPVASVPQQPHSHARLREIAELRNRPCDPQQDILETQRRDPFRDCGGDEARTQA